MRNFHVSRIDAQVDRMTPTRPSGRSDPPHWKTPAAKASLLRWFHREKHPDGSDLCPNQRQC